MCSTAFSSSDRYGLISAFIISNIKYKKRTKKKSNMFDCIFYILRCDNMSIYIIILDAPTYIFHD